MKRKVILLWFVDLAFSVRRSSWKATEINFKSLDIIKAKLTNLQLN